MPNIRKPSGILVTGVDVYVKDPDAADGSLFADYVRIPGLSSVTLPDEAAPENDVILLDGAVSATGFAGTGQIALPIGALGQHPTHRLLARKRSSGDTIDLAMERVAVAVLAIDDAVTVSAGDLDIAAVAAGARARVKNAVREGMIVALADSSADIYAGDWDATGAVANAPANFRAVVTVDDTGATIVVAPAVGAAVSSAVKLTVRQPGMKWENILCQVPQMAGGDFQSANVVAGNLVLKPVSELPVSSVVVDTDPTVS